MKKLCFLILVLTSQVCSLKSQTWAPVGTMSFSHPVYQFTYTGFALDNNGYPWVAYPDNTYGGKMSVMKYNGSNWVYVGNPGFSAGTSYECSIAFNAANQPYVAFGDGGNSSKASVMMYNGSNWVYVGAAGFSNGVVNDLTIKFGTNDTAYVAYSDASYTGRAVVRRFNGSNWVDIGTPGFCAGGVGQMKMALNALNQPYIAYQDQANGFMESCMMYNGSSWVHVGASTFSAGTVQYSHITFDNSGMTPYVCYNTGSGNFGPNLQYFNGSNWNYVGMANFNNDYDYQNDVALDAGNTPFVVIPDGSYMGKASVMYWTGSLWLYAGNMGFSTGGQTMFPNIAIDSANNIYAAYWDQGDSNKISVMRLNAITTTVSTNSGIKMSVYPNPATDRIQIEMESTISSAELNLIDVTGKEVLNENHLSGKTISLDVSSLCPGSYIVEIRDGTTVIRSRLIKR